MLSKIDWFLAQPYIVYVAALKFKNWLELFYKNLIDDKLFYMETVLNYARLLLRLMPYSESLKEDYLFKIDHLDIYDPIFIENIERIIN